LPKVVASRYKVEKLLGKGAAGKVYLAGDKLEDNKQLALKLLEASGSRHLELMRHEFSILTKISHPNIAQVYDFGFDENTKHWFYTSEYIEGKDIVETCKKLDVADKSRLFAQVLRALQHIHSRGIIHYDVKPGNIIVDKEGAARLIDFGLAMTETPLSGAMRGTIGYAAPEVVRGELGDPRSDLYSLGIVFYQTLMGKCPFEDESVFEVLRMQASSEPEPLHKLDQSIPLELSRLVLRLLECEPGSRYFTANDVNRALAHATDITLEEETTETALAYLHGGGFVGRDEDLNNLQSMFGSPDDGLKAPSVFFITGETGIGKSRLMREAGYYAQLNGISVVYSRCVSAKSQPFSPFGNIVQNVSGALPAEEMKRFDSIYKILLGETVSREATDREGNIYETINLLLEATRGRSILIAIDDIEQAEDDTLALLERLAQILRLKREEGEIVKLFVLCSGNTEHTQAKSSLELIEKLTGLETAGQVALSTLSEEDERNLLSAMMGSSELPTQLIEVVRKTAAGNPLFIEQTVQYLYDEGLLFYETGKWRTSAALLESLTPQAGEDILRQKIDIIPENQRITTEALACIGRPGDFELVKTAAGIPAETLAESIRQLLSRRLLVSSDEGEYYFRSGQMRDVILNSMPPEHRKAIHERIFTHMDKTGADLIERALQAHMAGIDSDSLIPLMWEAAEHAEKVTATSSAIQLYEKLQERITAYTEDWYKTLSALIKNYRSGGKVEEIYACLEKANHESLWQFPKYAMHIVASKIDSARLSGTMEHAEKFLTKAKKKLSAGNRKKFRAEILTETARVAEFKGELEKSLELMTEARKLFVSRRAKEEIDRLDYHLAMVDYRSGRYKDATKRANQILSRKSGQSLYPKIHNMLGVLYRTVGKPEKALDHYKLALKREEESGHLFGIAYIKSNIGIVFSDLGEYDKALDAFASSKRVFQACGDLLNYGIVLAGIGSAHLNSGGVKEALVQYEELADVAERTSNSLLLQIALSSRGHAFSALGNAGAALADLNRTLESAVEEKSRNIEASTLIGRADTLSLLCGDIAGAQEDLKRVINVLEEEDPITLGEAMATSAKLSTLTGDTEQAGALIAQAKNLKITGRGKWTIEIAQAELHLAIGNIPAAKRVISRLEKGDLNALLKTDLSILKARYGLKTGDKNMVQQNAEWALKTAQQMEYAFLRFQAALILAQGAVAAGKTKRAAEYFAEVEEVFNDIASSLPEGYSRESLRASPSYRPMDDVDKWLKERHSKETPSDYPDEDILLKTAVLKAVGEDENLVARQGLALLGMITRLATTDLDIVKLLELALAMVIDFTQAQRGFIILVDEGGEFRHMAARNILDKEITSPQYETSHTMVRQVIQTGKPRLVKDTAADESLRHAKSIVDLGLKSVLCAPIIEEKHSIGVVYLDSASPDHIFSKADLNFLKALVKRIAPVIARAVEHEKRDARLRFLEKEVRTRYAYTNIIGKSKPMRELFRVLDSAIDTDLPVYIYGETGTGKELVAKALHYNSSRKDGLFVSINCGAMTESLLESELFGYEKGAFTGADSTKKGLFEISTGGTLFLDEIANMSQAMQQQLLRALQEKEIRRIGGDKQIKVNVRIISASNVDPYKLIEAGKLREDLFYRLNVLTIELPPLRERREDIPLLFQHFWEKATKAPIQNMSKDEEFQKVIKAMMNYDWPGNVRELENEVSRLVTLGDGKLKAGNMSKKSIQDYTLEQLPEYVGSFLIKDMEKILIKAALNETKGNKSRAAKLLGIPRTSLGAKIKKLQIADR